MNSLRYITWGLLGFAPFPLLLAAALVMFA